MTEKCKACDGRGVQVSGLTGMFDRCPACDGTGEWRKPGETKPETVTPKDIKEAWDKIEKSPGRYNPIFPYAPHPWTSQPYGVVSAPRHEPVDCTPQVTCQAGTGPHGPMVTPITLTACGGTITPLTGGLAKMGL